MIVVVSSSGTVTGPFPDPTPDEPAPITPTFQVALIGGNGDRFDLTHGNVLLAPGAQLFAAPDVAHWWQESPQADGAQHDGMRTPRQDKQLPLLVLGDDWRTWRDLDSSLFRAMHPRDEFTLSVTSPDAETRSLGLRFVAGGDLETDPLTYYFAAYALDVVAANPFWQGDPVVYTFAPREPLPMFPGPPFNINPSSTLTSATVSNPGDEPAWPRYTIQGPAVGWTVGLGDVADGGALISSDVELLAGQSVTVDTHPSKLTVLDELGVNVYGNLSNDTFNAIPAATDYPLTLSLDGYGTGSQVRVEFTPLYRRPW